MIYFTSYIVTEYKMHMFCADIGWKKTDRPNFGFYILLHKKNRVFIFGRNRRQESKKKKLCANTNRIDEEKPRDQTHYTDTFFLLISSSDSKKSN